MGYSGVKVKVTQGPEHYMELQVARQEITTLIPMVDPTQKQALINALLRTHPCNEILAQLYSDINSMQPPTQNEMELQKLCEQMKTAIDGKDQEILSLTQQLEETRKQVENTDKSLQAELLKAKMNHEFKMEEIALQSQLNGNIDADKAAAEADKAQMDVESKAIALETQKVKSAAEIARTMQVPVVGMGV
jgi:arginine/lysine/ornithine decarboxylase